MTYIPRWLLCLAIAIVAGGGAALAWWRSAPAMPEAMRLDGKLTVLVRPPDRKIDPIPVEQPGALPVRSGGAMCLDAQINQPAFIYLLWIDSEHRVLPLYPWNNETLDVTDANEPAPVRRASKLVFSPLLGRTWTFGDRPGMETVVVLARRTPIPSDVHLGSFFESLPSGASVSDSLTTIKFSSGPAQVRAFRAGGDDAGREAEFAAGNLLTLLGRLRMHFDFIEAVQFPHSGEAAPLPAEQPPAEPKN